MPLVASCPLMLDRFIERIEDVEDDVRLAALDGVATILVTAASLDQVSSRHEGGSAAFSDAAAQLCKHLVDRCLDPCEAVRVRLVEAAVTVGNFRKGVEFLLPILPDIC